MHKFGYCGSCLFLIQYALSPNSEPKLQINSLREMFQLCHKLIPLYQSACFTRNFSFEEFFTGIFAHFSRDLHTLLYEHRTANAIVCLDCLTKTRLDALKLLEPTPSLRPLILLRGRLVNNQTQRRRAAAHWPLWRSVWTRRARRASCSTSRRSRALSSAPCSSPCSARRSARRCSSTSACGPRAAHCAPSTSAAS